MQFLNIVFVLIILGTGEFFHHLFIFEANQIHPGFAWGDEYTQKNTHKFVNTIAGLKGQLHEMVFSLVATHVGR